MTSRSPHTPGTGTEAPVTNGAVNRLLVSLLDGPAARGLGHHLAVVEYRGRRTGVRRRLVVLYSADGDLVSITVGRAEHKTWWRNFENTRAIRLRRAGVDHEGIAHVVRSAGRVTVLVRLTPTSDLGPPVVAAQPVHQS